MRVPPVACAALIIVVTACASDRSNPIAPRQSNTPSLSASVSGPATPPFNDEIILRAIGDGPGFGHVKFRQPKDANLIVYLDTWVRDLAPNASYRLQRAVDTNVNDLCTGTMWLTLGEGPTPRAIVTDDQGTGRAPLWRTLPATLLGTEFDIHFRLIDATGAVVLESGCYQYVVSQ